MRRIQAFLLVAALCVACFSGRFGAQTASPGRDAARQVPAGTGSIRGRVFAADTKGPLRRVQLVLQWSGSAEFRRVTQTDAQGRYEFVELPAGSFLLNASAPGYVGLQYGQRRPYEGGTSIAIRDGDTAASIDFALPRGSVIAGRITDEFGQPMVQAQVQAQRFRYMESGQRSLVRVVNDTTDDRGEFRLFGLMPGEYVVDASVRTVANIPGASTNPNHPIEGFQPTFYPGLPHAGDARPITLAVGEEKRIQFAVMSARLVRVTGIAHDSQGRPLYPAQVTMWTRMGEMFSVAPGGTTSTMTDADGSFAFAGVVPGEYVLEVHTRLPGALGPPAVAESGALALTVGSGDVTGIQLTTSTGARVSGRVFWEGSAFRTSSAATRLRVSAQTVESVGPGSIRLSDTLDETGDFEIGGLFGRVALSVPMPANSNWTLRSVTLDGQDITDVPLDLSARSTFEGVEIVMTDKLTHVSGQVIDGSGNAVTQYVVVMQPAVQKEPRVGARYIRTARPDTYGRFEIRNVRPGRYVATAVEALEDGRQFSPEFQRELRRGAREFSLSEGETLSLDLRLMPGL